MLLRRISHTILTSRGSKTIVVRFLLWNDMILIPNLVASRATDKASCLHVCGNQGYLNFGALYATYSHRVLALILSYIWRLLLFCLMTFIIISQALHGHRLGIGTFQNPKKKVQLIGNGFHSAMSSVYEFQGSHWNLLRGCDLDVSFRIYRVHVLTTSDYVCSRDTTTKDLKGQPTLDLVTCGTKSLPGRKTTVLVTTVRTIVNAMNTYTNCTCIQSYTYLHTYMRACSSVPHNIRTRTICARENARRFQDVDCKINYDLIE